MGAGGDVGSTFERSARFWMRAYPRRWRAARGEELLGVLTDLAGPGARHLGIRSALGLVVAGWGTRWRGRPPLGPWLRYRLDGAALPREYRPWVADDIAGALYPERWWYGWRLCALAAWMLLFLGLTSLPQLVGSLLGGVVLLHVFGGRQIRVAGYERQLVTPPGERRLPGDWVAVDRARPRAPALWVSGRLVAALVVAAVLQVPVAFLRATGDLMWSTDRAQPEVDAVVVPVRGLVLVGCVLAVVVGLLVAARARHHLTAGPTTLPDQPFRQVRRPGWRAELASLLGLLVAAAVAGATAAGGLPVGVSATLAAAALSALPWAVVLRRTAVAAQRASQERGESSGAARGASPREPAWSDLVWTALHRTPPPVDAPVREPCPWEAAGRGSAPLGTEGRPGPMITA